MTTLPLPAGTLRQAGGCILPVLLRGRVDHIDGATGELLHRYSTVYEPGGVLPVACKTRRASRCPPCAEVYSADTYQLIRAELSGGKGLPIRSPPTRAYSPPSPRPPSAPSTSPARKMAGSCGAVRVGAARSARVARPTRGSADLIITAYRTGRTVTIVSNNSSAAIGAYLADHRLDGYIRAIVARDDHDPERMKPSPYRVREAVSLLDAEHAECVLVGDSTTDVLAGHLAGVAVIGYADKPGKAQALADVQAAAVTNDLAEITTALRNTA